VDLIQRPTFEDLFFISFRGHERTLLLVRKKIIKTRPTMGRLHVTLMKRASGFSVKPYKNLLNFDLLEQIGCDICPRWFHETCLKMNEKEVNDAKEMSDWKCLIGNVQYVSRCSVVCRKKIYGQLIISSKVPREGRCR